jgi:hypothetical protein
MSKKKATPLDLEPPFRFMFVARSQSGKTSLLIKLLLGKWIRLFDKVYIFCPTYFLDNKWLQVDKYVKEGKVKVLTVVDEKKLKKIHTDCSKRKISNPEYHTMIIFDDCVGQEGFKTNSDKGIINKLTCKGNHANISTVWSIQKLTMCSTIMRNQAEGIVLFYCQEKELKMLHAEYGTGSFKFFQKMVELSTTKPYSTMFINRQGPGRPRYFNNFKLINLDSINELLKSNSK